MSLSVDVVGKTLLVTLVSLLVLPADTVTLLDIDTTSLLEEPGLLWVEFTCALVDTLPSLWFCTLCSTLLTLSVNGVDVCGVGSGPLVLVDILVTVFNSLLVLLEARVLTLSPAMNGLGGLQDTGCDSNVSNGIFSLATDTLSIILDFSCSLYTCSKLFGVMFRYCLLLEGLNTATCKQ